MQGRALGRAKAEWGDESVNISAGWTADAWGHSQGQRFGLGLDKEWHQGQHAIVIPYVTAHWLDKKCVDYCYGVRAAEATAERAAHVGRGRVNVDIGLRTMYWLDEHHSMLLEVVVTRLAEWIKSSPLVNRSSANQVILGYLYSF